MENVQEIQIRLASNTHSRDELIFLNTFKENHKYQYAIHDIENSVRKEIEKLFKEKYDLTEIFRYEICSEREDEDEDEVLPIKHVEDISKIKDSTDVSYIDTAKKLLINFDDGYTTLYSKSPIDKVFKEKVEKIFQMGVDKRKRNSIHILSSTQERGMHLSDFKIDDKFLELDIESNYNTDFKDIHESIIENLGDQQVGLYLLHGPAGTGKCVVGETKIKVKNKITGDIEEINIDDLM